MVRCQYCGKEVALPFRCRYCGGLFCVEHHLPEKHECPGLRRGAEAFRELVAVREAELAAERRRRRLKPRAPALIRRGEAMELAAAAALVSLVYVPTFIWLGGLVVACSVVAAFLAHEMSHKLAATNLGYLARFRLSKLGALLTLISALPFVPIKVIAPGYVQVVSIGRLPSVRDEGLIAVAGPLSNILLAAVAGAALLAGCPLASACLLFAKVNMDIALLNLMPLPILDGEKVFRWSATAWAVLLLIALIADLRLTFWLL